MMGWASGSELLIQVAKSVRSYLSWKQPRTNLVSFYEEIVDCLSSMDCDTIDEALGIDLALDLVILRRRAEWDDEMDADYVEELKRLEAWLIGNDL